MKHTAPAHTAPGLPRRLPGPAHTSRMLLVGGCPRLVSAARRWAAQATRYEPLAHRVEGVASELITNALRHTRSGDPDGVLHLEMERGPHLILRITDNGPRPGSPPTVPHIPPLDVDTPGGQGLRIVQSLAEYWGWAPAHGGLTVHAVFAWNPTPPDE